MITVGTQQIQLASDYIRLSELGSSLQAREDRGNLDRLYRMAYTVAQPDIRAKLPTPERVAHESIAVMQADIELVALELDLANMNVFHPIGVLVPPSAATCQAEAGYEDGTDGATGSCAGYATNGIMRNIAFPLRDDLTCMRDQGRRGTCTAFATTAAVETAVHVMNGNKVNLSEQHAYWYGETTVEPATRYTYGLNAADYVQALADNAYELRREKIWNYNPSRSMGAKVGNLYPTSCVGYSGEECSDYAFQSDEIPVFGGFLYPDPMPNAGAFYVEDAVEIGTDALGLSIAKAVLDAQIPLVAAIDVPSSFRAPTADGYVTYVANQCPPPCGGHAVHVAGWVDNAALPAAAPRGSGGGYFVLKNSWGEGPGDCGYYYVPYDFLLNYGRSLTTLSVQ